MLVNLLDGWFKFPVGEGAFYALFGFAFVFVGIALIILILTLMGKLLTFVNKKRAEKADRSRRENVRIPEEKASAVKEDEVSPEVVAAITAALTAYYEQERAQCDFVVRRIKKI